MVHDPPTQPQKLRWRENLVLHIVGKCEVLPTCLPESQGPTWALLSHLWQGHPDFLTACPQPTASPHTSERTVLMGTWKGHAPRGPLTWLQLLSLAHSSINT